MGLLENVGGWEIILIVLVGLFILGPDRLPKVTNDAVRALRALRRMARGATDDLSRELGRPVDLDDLHPKTFIRKHLLSVDEERMLRQPLESVYGQLRAELADMDRSVTGATATMMSQRGSSKTPGMYKEHTDLFSKSAPIKSETNKFDPEAT